MLSLKDGSRWAEGTKKGGLMVIENPHYILAAFVHPDVWKVQLKPGNSADGFFNRFGASYPPCNLNLLGEYHRIPYPHDSPGSTVISSFFKYGLASRQQPSMTSNIPYRINSACRLLPQ